MNGYSWNLDNIYSNNQFDDIMKNIYYKNDYSKREIISIYHFCCLKLYLNYKDYKYKKYKDELKKLFPFLANKNSNYKEAYISILNSFENCSIAFKGKKINFNSAMYSKIMNSNDRLLKKVVFNWYLDKLKKNNIQLIKLFQEIKYNNVKENNNLYNKTMENSIEYFNEFINYYKKRSKLKKVYLYDIFNGSKRKMSIDKSLKLIKESLNPLNISNDIDDIFKNNRIDLYPNKNKTFGYFTVNTYDLNSFILFNYNGTYKDLFVLSHEIGHYIAYQLRKKDKLYHDMVNYDDLEIPSLTFELMVAYYLYNNKKNKNNIINILNIFLNAFYRYGIFNQFEQELSFNNQQISIEQIYLNLIKKYFYNMEIVDNQKYEFLSVRQLLKCNYCYQYSKSLIISLSIVKKMMSNIDYCNKFITFITNAPNFDDEFLNKYLNIDVNKQKIYIDFIRELRTLIMQLKEI